MSGVRIFKKFLNYFIIISLVKVSSIFAEKMDLEAHDLVIGKLESTLQSLKPNDQSINPVFLKIQLANLYSEKARILIVEEGKINCENCMHSSEIRKKAIDLYKTVKSEDLDSDGGQTSLQLAYLLETKNSDKSFEIYNRLIGNKKTSSPNLIKSYSKRAEYFFKNGKFDNAISDYKKAQLLTSKKEEQLPFSHKIAWAHFNKGEIEKSTDILMQILTSIKASIKIESKNEANEIYEGFQIEVARDLYLFISKLKVSVSLLEKIFDLTPDSERASNLQFFSEESERIGELDNAVIAWEILIKNKEIKEVHRTKAFLGLSRFYRDNFQYSKSIQSYKNALEISTSLNEDFAFNLKQFLTQWEKQIKKFTKLDQIKTSQNALLISYENYLKKFNNQYEVFLWHAQLAQKLNYNEKSLESFSNASELIFRKLNEETSNSNAKVNILNLKELLNEILKTEISIAETTNNPKLKLSAYNHYLNLNPDGLEKLKVQYQKAKLYYDLNDHNTAFDLFNLIAINSNFKNSELKIKSAHLALDCLALQSNINKLETQSRVYAEKFPQQENDFMKISFKAGMEITKSILQKENSLNSYQNALEKLYSLKIRPSSISSQDYKNYLQAKIDLEIKTQNWKSAQSTLSNFISLKTVTNEERNWALKKELSISEFLLDFISAHKIIIKLNYLNSNDPKELLKGALISDLAQKPIAPWLEKVIKSPKSNRDQVELARIQLIRHSSSPWKSLHQMRPFFKGKAKLFSSVALECYNIDARLDEIPWVLSFPGVDKTWEGQTFQRILAINELKKLSHSPLLIPLNSKNEKVLDKSLKSRITLLKSLETQFYKSQKSGDWTLDLLYGIRLKNENQKLATEIENLPIPKILSAKNQKNYSQELSKIALPFRTSAMTLEHHLNELWKDQTHISTLLKIIDINDRVRATLLNELSIIVSLAPKSISSDIQSQLDKLKSRPTKNDVASLKIELQNDPFDTSLHEQLLKMEKQRGNQSMVVFLQARGQNLKGGHL